MSEAVKGVCAQCPFKEGAEYAYDQDAKDMLDKGEVPACHMMQPGPWIFQESPCDPTHPCKGYEAWCAGKPGFKEPRVED